MAMSLCECICKQHCDCICGTRFTKMFENHMPFNRANMVKKTDLEISCKDLCSSRTNHTWSIREFNDFLQFSKKSYGKTYIPPREGLNPIDNFILGERTYLATDKSLDLHLALSRVDDSISILILIRSIQTRPIFTRFEFAVIKPAEDEENEAPEIILRYNMMCEFGTNVARALLMKRWTVLNPAKRWITDGVLTLSINVSAKYLPRKVPISRPTLTCENLLKSINNLFNTGNFSDIVIKSSDGVEFKAHKAILGSRNEYFASLLDHDDISKTPPNLIHIDDFKGTIVQELLRYIYIGEVHDVEDNAADFIVLADKYIIPWLKDECEEILSSTMTYRNAIEILRIAEKSNSKTLTTKACNFIVKYSEIIISNNDNNHIGKVLKSISSASLGDIATKLSAQAAKQPVDQKDYEATAAFVFQFNMVDHVRIMFSGERDYRRERRASTLLSFQETSLQVEQAWRNLYRWLHGHPPYP